MRHTAGFTMIEAMVVLALVGILAALSYPSYRQYVVRARRSEAQVKLVELMQQQERYYTYHNRYLALSSDSSDPDEQRFRWWMGDKARTSAYEMHGEACPGQAIERCVNLVAVPGTDKVDRLFHDPECHTLSLRSTGERASSGSGTRCWR